MGARPPSPQAKGEATIERYKDLVGALARVGLPSGKKNITNISRYRITSDKMLELQQLAVKESGQRLGERTLHKKLWSHRELTLVEAAYVWAVAKGKCQYPGCATFIDP